MKRSFLCLLAAAVLLTSLPMGALAGEASKAATAITAAQNAAWYDTLDFTDTR